MELWRTYLPTLSPAGEMVTVVEHLSPCTQYRLVIGAGPVRQADQEDETILPAAWIFEEEPLKTFASTSPVSQPGILDYFNLLIFYTLKIGCRMRRKVRKKNL